MENLKKDLLELIDPSVNEKLSVTKGLAHLGYDDEKDVVLIEILVEQKIDSTENLRKEIIKLVKGKYKYKGIKLEINERKIHESIANSGIPCIGIISGKGGVGKSSVAANIAYRLMKKGIQTALIDADIYGSSIPELLEMEHQNPYMNENGKIIPLKKESLEVISTDFFTQEHEPVIWRAGMLHKMLEYFFFDTAWNPLTKVIIIDFPPGTGDVMLDMNNFVKNPKMLLVTTPHPASTNVAIKAGIAANKMNQEILGVVENMSYYKDDETQKNHYIFGKDGGLTAAKNLGVELIAQLPISVPKHHQCIFEITEENGKIYDDIADFIVFSQNIK